MESLASHPCRTQFLRSFPLNAFCKMQHFKIPCCTVHKNAFMRQAVKLSVVGLCCFSDGAPRAPAAGLHQPAARCLPVARARYCRRRDYCVQITHSSGKRTQQERFLLFMGKRTSKTGSVRFTCAVWPTEPKSFEMAGSRLANLTRKPNSSTVAMGLPLRIPRRSEFAQCCVRDARMGFVFSSCGTQRLLCHFVSLVARFSV